MDQRNRVPVLIMDQGNRVPVLIMGSVQINKKENT